MQVEYYGPTYPSDTPQYKIPKSKKDEYFNLWIYRNRLMIPTPEISNVMPTVDWRFRWYVLPPIKRTRKFG